MTEGGKEEGEDDDDISAGVTPQSAPPARAGVSLGGDGIRTEGGHGAAPTDRATDSGGSGI